MTPDGWIYSGLDQQRLDRLLTPEPMASIVEQILSASRLTGLNTEERCNEQEGRRVGAARLVFTLLPLTDQACHAMDWLLNGVGGLRARYAVDPDSGADANKVMCEAIAAEVEAGRLRPPEGLAPESAEALLAGIRTAVRGDSAKVWYDGPTDKMAGCSAGDGGVD